MSVDPRYPVGPFSAPATFDDSTLAGWRRDVSDHPRHFRAAVAGLNDGQLDTPYRDGGWTVRQVVHHVADSHMNAYCRFKLALTEDNPTIKPYLQAEWAKLPDSTSLPAELSLNTLELIHQRWTTVIEAMSPTDWQRTFFHPENKRNQSLWHALALYSWHGKHHTAHITTLRKQRGW